MQREIIMTVCAIKGNLMNATAWGDKHTRYVMGRTTIEAQGDGEFHTWETRGDERYWIGDRITVTVIEDDPSEDPGAERTPPPPIDERAAS